MKNKKKTHFLKKDQKKERRVRKTEKLRKK